MTNIGFQLKFQITFYDRIRSVLSYLAYFLEFFFFNDFDVRITDDCELDEKTVLMIFCSYYSDQSADANASSSSSSKKSGS